MGAWSGGGAGSWARAAIALASVASSTTTARAREPATSRFELEWDAPERCLDREAARKAIEDALGDKRVGAHAVVRVRIAETESGRCSADIWMYDETGGGERSFEGGSCAQVAQATALIVALALEASRAPDPTAIQRSSATERAVVHAQPDAAERVRFGVGVRAQGDAGSLPEADAGIALALELHYLRFRAEAEGSAWLPETAEIGPVAGTGGEFALYTGGLRGCFDLLPNGITWSLGPCAGAEAGSTTASGVRLAARRSSSVFWAAGVFGFALRFLGASPVGVGLLAELGVPFHRAAWQIDDLGPVFQPSPVIGRASLGVSYLFP